MTDLLTAAEAAKYLDIKVSSLYTYASRGLLQSVPGPKPGGRSKRYRRSDLDRLKARHDARSGHGAVAGGALRWGEPVLSTELTGIEPDAGLLYRGRPIADLLDQPFEAVAELLWTGALPPVRPGWVTRGLGLVPVDLLSAVPPGTPPLPSLGVAVPVLAARDDERFGAAESAELHRGRRLVRRMAALLALGQDIGRCGPALGERTVAATVLRALGTETSEPAVAAVDRALVLCADHGLNASTFAARVAASTGADLYACISAALAALSGWRHGGACERVEALLDEVGRPDRAGEVIRARAARGETVPGFGHPLYEGGDPRTAPLVEVARELGADRPRVKILLAVVAEMAHLGHAPPTLDIGLVGLSSALGLPRGSAEALFAIGRSAGWVAHALEQRRAGFLLRPRARYVGQRPS